MYELTIITGFSAAHNLRNYEGACERTHGHNWKVEVFIEAEKLNSTELAVDFKVLKKEAEAVVSRLDHRHLNEVPPFDRINTTAENLARYIYDELKKTLNDGNVRVKKVRVWESDRAAAAYHE